MGGRKEGSTTIHRNRSGRGRPGNKATTQQNKTSLDGPIMLTVVYSHTYILTSTTSLNWLAIVVPYNDEVSHTHREVQHKTVDIQILNIIIGQFLLFVSVPVTCLRGFPLITLAMRF